ncbi:LAMI_0D12134g1_1 [Lachancea mirantina]|uniref:Peroxisomal membrane protein PEX13 n=1 Tax=Lachancea mirantina TaxID=1230905 RepID=A0A1G4JFF9_9SACH|nr:LAMI_0D12134g1_1 [Lachancea mirantina]
MSSSTSLPRPKPWETNQANIPNEPDVNIAGSSVSSLTNQADNASASDGRPDLPEKPDGLGSVTNTSNVAHMRNNMNGGIGSYYNGNSAYGGAYGNSPYGGGFGSMYGSGYGSLYGGGYGSMYGGGFGTPYGGGMYGMNGGANGPQNLAESTQATFQLIEGLIGAVAGFAQMLEATYMATHNSFFTMISVAEQFSSLKEMVGSFFGIFAAMKVLKKVLYKLSNGRLGSPPQRAKTLQNGEKTGLIEEFDRFQASDGKARPKRRISWKPLLVFLAAVFGFPYLLNKFITGLARVQSRKLGTRISGDGTLDPRNLEFGRAIYDFTPENPQIEVTLKKGDLMAIISKDDPLGNVSQWWKVRTKRGDIGYAPHNYIEVIKRRNQIESVEEERGPEQTAVAEDS